MLIVNCSEMDTRVDHGLQIPFVWKGLKQVVISDQRKYWGLWGRSKKLTRNFNEVIVLVIDNTT